MVELGRITNGMRWTISIFCRYMSLVVKIKKMTWAVKDRPLQGPLLVDYVSRLRRRVEHESASKAHDYSSLEDGFVVILLRAYGLRLEECATPECGSTCAIR